eukprot:scaffold98538_cov52-Attheya_sp.AAC.5
MMGIVSFPPMFLLGTLVLAFSPVNVSSFCPTGQHVQRRAVLQHNMVKTNQDENDVSLSRRLAFQKASSCMMVAATTGTIFGAKPVLAAAEEETENGGGVMLYSTKSGLQYIDLIEGTGPTPKYGQLCSIAYQGYIKLPQQDLKGFDDDDRYLVKHGNGRMIPGIDEGLHTLKVGGTRRLIIPAKLGYVTFGLGPLPATPWARYNLNSLLNKMVESKGGNIIFDVTLYTAFDDEADQGYYDDDSPTPENFNSFRQAMQAKASENAAAKKSSIF